MVKQKGRRPAMVWIVSAICCVGFPCIALGLMSFLAKAPDGLGVRNGRLAPCPATPNCVSTQAETQQHWIAPLTPPDSDIAPVARIARIVRSLPRTCIVEQSETYLRAEFRSRIFRFCDDAEFFYDVPRGQIHFRSASRVGQSDLGVNRRRMEGIRQQFDASAPRVPSTPTGRKSEPRSSASRQLVESSS